MNPVRQLGPLDDPPLPAVDVAWTGVDERHAPGQLLPGVAARGRNVRFTDGTVTTRGGIRKMPWGDGIPVLGETGVGLAHPGGATGAEFGTVIRAREYTDPATNQAWIVTVYRYTDNSLAITRACSGNRSRPVTVASGITTAGEVELIQTFSGMVLLCEDRDPLYLVNWSLGFNPVPVDAPPGVPVGLTYTRCPRGTAGIYWQGRLWVVSESVDPVTRDAIWVGNVGSSRNAVYGDPVLRNYFAVNAGSQDRLIGLYPLNDTTLIAGKQRSIHVVTGVYGDNDTIAQTVTVQVLTTEFGIASPRAFVQVGGDVWFLATERGVMSVTATAEGRNLGRSVPVSEALTETVSRINWARAREATATAWGNKVYFAVPTGNTATEVLVYDTRTQAWAGSDTSDALELVDWVQFGWNGSRRLGFVHRLGPVMLYEEGDHDDVLRLESGLN